MTLPPDTIELVTCTSCGARDAGTGQELTRRGWRHHRFAPSIGTHFYCGECLHDNRDFIRSAA